MSKLENLPSITNRNVDDTALIVEEVDEMLDLTRVINGEINHLDMESLIKKLAQC